MSNVYVIFDKKAGIAFGDPVFFANHVSALRFCGSLVRDTHSPLSTYSEDFRLIHIGTYNPETLAINCFDVSEIICEFSDLLIPSSNNINTNS